MREREKQRPRTDNRRKDGHSLHRAIQERPTLQRTHRSKSNQTQALPGRAAHVVAMETRLYTAELILFLCTPATFPQPVLFGFAPLPTTSIKININISSLVLMATAAIQTVGGTYSKTGMMPSLCHPSQASSDGKPIQEGSGFWGGPAGHQWSGLVKDWGRDQGRV